jgi:hypothetical protein
VAPRSLIGYLVGYDSTNILPQTEKSKIKKGGDILDLVVKCGHGEEAFADMFGGVTKLKNKVRTVIGKAPVGLDGKVTVRWAKIPVAKKLAIISMLHKAAPWLNNFDMLNGYSAEQSASNG